MLCPYCKNLNSPKKVIRTWLKNGRIKRRRKCLHCNSVFITIESVVETVMLEDGQYKRLDGTATQGRSA